MLNVKTKLFRKFKISILVCAVLAISGCGDNWEGIVFHDKDKLLMYSTIGPFKTFEECRDASMEKLESLKALDKGYYECGKNCKAGTSSYNRGCEDSTRGNVYK